ncbi:RICIN domain-containing protein [Streptomyces sparsogenes]
MTVANRDPGDNVPIRQYQCEGDFAQHFTISPPV